MRFARQGGSGSVGRLHTLDNTKTSHYHCVIPPKMVPECPYLWILTEVSLSRHFDWIIIQWCLISICVLVPPQSSRKFTPVATPLMIFVTTSITECFSGPLLWLVSRPMKDRKFQQFQQAWGMWQVRIKYVNKIVVNSGWGRRQIWIMRNSQKGTWGRAWTLS